MKRSYIQRGASAALAVCSTYQQSQGKAELELRLRVLTMNVSAIARRDRSADRATLGPARTSKAAPAQVAHRERFVFNFIRTTAITSSAAGKFGLASRRAKRADAASCNRADNLGVVHMTR